MAQAAVERTRRQEDRSATGTFLLLLSVSPLEGRSAYAEARTTCKTSTGNRKRALDPRGERPLSNPDNVESHGQDIIWTGSDRQICSRSRKSKSLPAIPRRCHDGNGAQARRPARACIPHAAIWSASAMAEAASSSSISRSCFFLAPSSSPNWKAPPMRD